MGHFQHHAIIVTGMGLTAPSDRKSTTMRALRDDSFKFFQAFAPEAFVSELSETTVNDYQSFTVFPDGSKEGWETSNRADEARKTYCELLDEKIADINYVCFDYVEVSFAAELGGADHVVRGSHDEPDLVDVKPPEQIQFLTQTFPGKWYTCFKCGDQIFGREEMWGHRGTCSPTQT